MFVPSFSYSSGLKIFLRLCGVAHENSYERKTSDEKRNGEELFIENRVPLAARAVYFSSFQANK